MVGGGGGGVSARYSGSGGGGGGGVLTNGPGNKLSLAAGAYTITVGAGGGAFWGVPGTNNASGQGKDGGRGFEPYWYSVVPDATAAGGGGGGYGGVGQDATSTKGGDGGGNGDAGVTVANGAAGGSGIVIIKYALPGPPQGTVLYLR